MAKKKARNEVANKQGVTSKRIQSSSRKEPLSKRRRRNRVLLVKLKLTLKCAVCVLANRLKMSQEQTGLNVPVAS